MIRPLMFVASAALILSACDRAAQDAPAAPAASPATPADAPSPAPAAPASNTLTAQGFGPLRVGMTLAEVEAVMGADANPGAVGGADPQSCDQFRPERAPEGLLVMMQGGRLSSVSLTRDTTPETDRGLNIGDTAAEVKRVYGAAAEAMPHKYEPAPAKYVFVWTGDDQTSPAARGLKYEIGQDGRVKSIAGGGPSIAYVEGCA